MENQNRTKKNEQDNGRDKKSKRETKCTVHWMHDGTIRSFSEFITLMHFDAVAQFIIFFL